MLTDKAKGKFCVFLKTKHKIGYWEYFESMPLVCQQALIVEWLDSIDLVIDADRFSDKCWQYSIDDGDFDAEYPQERGFETRPEALTKAIEKVNQIINLKRVER